MMRFNMVNRGFAVITALSIIILASACSLNNPPPAETDSVGYYTKQIILSSWVDTGKTWWDELETRLYDKSGKLVAVSKNEYTEMPHDSIFMVTRTDVYEVDNDGKLILVERYEYDYHEDRYEYINEEGELVVAYDYLLSRGETYSYNEDKTWALRLYYDVEYNDGDDGSGDGNGDGYDETPDTDPAYYTSIIDTRTSDGQNIAEQYATYLTDGQGGKYFRTEKYFSRKQDDSGLALEKEFASWYDEVDTWNYLYDLYHSFRGEDGSEEFYYFTRYSRNESGNIYEQADYKYSYDGPKDADGSFTSIQSSPLVYNIKFDNIGEKTTFLTTKYNERGDYLLDQRWFKGELIEYTSYAYDGSGRLTDQWHYTEGGTLLRDRKTIRFREQIIYGEKHSVKEICEYKDYNYSNTGPQEDISIGKMLRPYESYDCKSDLEIKHLQYSRLKNNYRK